MKMTVAGHYVYIPLPWGKGFWSSRRLGTKQLSYSIWTSAANRNIWCSAQEAYPRVNNSLTAGEPFLRLNSVWKLLFSCQWARGNLFHPILPPTKSRERAVWLPAGLSDHSGGAERHPLAFCTRQENKPPHQLPRTPCTVTPLYMV